MEQQRRLVRNDKVKQKVNHASMENLMRLKKKKKLNKNKSESPGVFVAKI